MDANVDQRDYVSTYGLLWRLVDLAVHRYGSQPTGELLVVLTLVLLDEVAYEPTLAELAGLVSLPKSTVSRYVAAQVRAGFIEERVDPADRRQRRLRSTELAHEERRWHWGEVVAIGAQSAGLPGETLTRADLTPQRIMQVMRRLAAKRPGPMPRPSD